MGGTYGLETGRKTLRAVAHVRPPPPTPFEDGLFFGCARAMACRLDCGDREHVGVRPPESRGAWDCRLRESTRFFIRVTPPRG